MDGSLGKKQSPGPIIPEEVAAELDAVATDARTERRTEAVSYTHLTLPTTPYV